MATHEQILTEWHRMKAAYPSSFVRATDDEITASQLIWIEQLTDVDYELLRAACCHYRSSDAEWFPPPGKVRKIMLELSQPRARRTGLEAWGDVVKAFQNVGYYRAPEFDDPVTSQVVRSLGWQNLCESEDQTADRARFIDAYNNILTRERSDALMLPEVQCISVARIERGNHNALAEIMRLAEAKKL